MFTLAKGEPAFPACVRVRLCWSVNIERAEDEQEQLTFTRILLILYLLVRFRYVNKLDTLFIFPLSV